MANKNSNYNRIAVNTVMLYFRMLLIMLVSLYTVRVLLSALGQEDYGIYNVVGGIVVLFSFLTHVLSSASQRFFAFYIGQDNYNELSKIYSAILLLFGIVSAVIIVLAETVGLWFLHNKMTIPPERMIAANWVYQFSIFSFCWKVITSPHQAIIIAHEKMNIYAYVGIAEVLLQLILVLILQRVSKDRLIVYAAMMLAIVFFINSIYIIYARIKYNRIKFVIHWDRTLFINVVSYSGWTLFGALASLVRSTGINIILNVYFTPLVNAARGIAHNVNSAVSSFSGNFYTAVRPQIVKYYAQGDLDSCFKLVFRSTKFAFFLLWMIALPILCYTPQILQLWLGDYPDYSVVFTRLILVVALIDSLANPLITFNQATGNIKWFQIIVSTIYILTLPLAISLFVMGLGPVSVFWVSIIISCSAIIARLLILRWQQHFPLREYYKQVLLPIIIVLALSLLLVVLWEFVSLPLEGFLLLAVNVVVILIIATFTSLMVGFNKVERQYAFKLVKSKIPHK